MNRVLAHTGAKYPIVQAPMGWIARTQPASAASRAGGLGIIEPSSGETDACQDEINQTKAPDLRFGVKFVTTSAGSPAKFIAPLKAAGVTVYHAVPTVEAALKCVDAGIDGLAVEGAGFKNPGEVSTLVLHQLVPANVDSPRRWAVLAIVATAQFMFGVDAFIADVAIPTIAIELEAVISVRLALFAAFALFALSIGASAAFLSWKRRAATQKPRSFEILGNDSTRPFYFAVQQLSVAGRVRTKPVAKELPLSLAKNVDYLRHLPKLHGFADFGRTLKPGQRSPIVETRDFGSNPGNLRMFSFAPDNLQPAPGLVVVLHGCGQTAAAYDLGAGWSTLAKHYGFALLMPEQQSFNNANGCFNWFSPEDTARDRGEACSIQQMIARAVEDIGIDRTRIFVTGLSAGGAMTSVMLATYPEIFAGGAVIAGLPYGVANNMREALSGMFQSPARPASELGDLVRNASTHKGPWPKLSVWHGSADRTVNPANANEIVKQWLDVHQLPSAPMSEGTVNGHPRQVWWNADGETVVESYTITDMAHGTPLGIGDNDKRYGNQGAFLIEAGISSSYQIANFFGLTEWIRRPQESAKQSAKQSEKQSARQSAAQAAKPATAVVARKAAKKIPLVAPAAEPAPVAAPDLTQLLWPLTTFNRPAEPPQQPKRRGIDVGGVITRALTAAGLMK